MIEWAIYLDGERILLHKEQDISHILNTLPRYTLPLRLEIKKNINDSGVSIGEMRQFNTGIYYETGYINTGSLSTTLIDNKCQLKHLSTINQLTFNINTTTYKPTFSVQLKTAYIRNPIISYEVLFMTQKESPFIYAIVRNAIFTNIQPSWVNPGNNYRLEYDITADLVDINNLDIIYEEYVNINGGTQIQNSKFNNSYTICFPAITSNIQGNADVFTILVKKLTPLNGIVSFNLRWIENN
jgi:hypothetical protein